MTRPRHPRDGDEVAQAYLTIGRTALALLDPDLRPVVEPGGFRITVERSSADLRLVGRLEAC